MNLLNTGLVTVSFFLVYFFFFLSFFFKNKTLFVVILFSFVTFYDFVFINLTPFVSPSLLPLFKSWQEYLVVFLIGVLVISFRKKPLTFSPFDLKFILALLLLTIVGAIAGVINGNGVGDIFLGWRMYLLPLTWSYILYKSKALHTIDISKATKCFFVFAGIIVLVAAYFDLSYTGNLRILWFYDFIDKLNPIEDHAFDFIRDDQLRATGVFVSPLIYATYLSFVLLLLIFNGYFKRHNPLYRLVILLLTVVVLYGQYISRTRIGFIIIVVGLACAFLAYVKPRWSIGWYMAIPGFFLGVTFVSLLFGVTEDLSALGRLVQYAALPSNFVMQGMGFGAEMTNVYFDSFYISSILLFGIFVPVYYYLFLLLYQQLHKQRVFIGLLANDTNLQAFFYATFGYGLSFIYTFGFHFTTGSSTVQLFFVSMFLVISRLESARQSQEAALAK